MISQSWKFMPQFDLSRGTRCSRGSRQFRSPKTLQHLQLNVCSYSQSQTILDCLNMNKNLIYESPFKEVGILE